MKVCVLPVGALMTNCYLLVDSKTKLAGVIDPGDDVKQIQELVEKEGVTVAYILLTHGHFDHTSGVPELSRAFPEAKLYIHREDANGVGSTLFPLSQNVEHLLFYQEGDTLELGELTIHVLHTPGHTPGSVVLQVEDTLFTGDTLFCSSCGRTDLPGGSYEQMMRSLKRLSQLPGDFHIYPGHDISSHLQQERETNLFLREAMTHRA